ncbi:hypothetical protein CHS0354_041372 [Potamilus streckersoni]|uniref:Uncharacterized protein n=1 Tax=Potamilus streckersoni TaxID=2493646 RepID=A0AAE0T9P1_9BIVA|nr:hypothetical protein CHS0354_041372 [Potamilus streckersoni]
MKLVIVLLGLACLAYAQDFPNLMGGMNIPPIPPGMKLDDLRESFRNLPPSMKEQLDSMARSYGMSIDDVEQALENPPEQLKQLFEQNTAKAPKIADDSVHGEISGIQQMPDMSAMLGMLGIPPDASPAEIQKLAIEKAEEMGFDLSDPEKLKETLKDQLKTIMPGVNLDELIHEPQKAIETTLKGMGIPTDDPKAMKKLVQDGLKEMGIDNVDIDNMDDLVEKLKKKAFQMLDIDENEDPELLKERVKKQVVEQLHMVGIDVKEDDNMETVQNKLTTAISEELKNFGIEVESDDPQEMASAIKKKLNEMGIKFDNIQELQKQIMGIFMQHAQSAFMNVMMPPPKQDNESKMPTKTPQSMMAPHFIPHMQYRAKEIVTDPSLSFGDDDHVMQHVMHVRSGLRSGFMSEDIVEEMLDELLHYHLKNTMLKEKLARIERMNDVLSKDLEMHQGEHSRILSAILKN